MNILLFGPPGAGKGTQSALLVDKLKMKHLSTGDILRAAMRNGTTLGLEAKSYMNDGKLVPDSLVIGMVDEELGEIGSQSFILDGFPRTVPQADALENLLKNRKTSIGRAIFLEVPKDQLLDRLTGRRVCKGCGATFHVGFKPPQKQGICDICGAEVIQREDDKESVIRTRLEAYEASTKPLQEYYQEKGILQVVDGLGSADEVFARIQKWLA